MPSKPAAHSPSDTHPATPTAFPAAGTFGVTQRITLLSATPAAAIHYTLDGSPPTLASPVFDPYKLPVLEAPDQAGAATFTLQALAAKPGLGQSAVATFDYTIQRRAKDEYLAKQIYPGIQMILDFDDTKMYLITGGKRALLIDAGLGEGDLRGFVEARLGGLPLDVLITHAHPDHVACMAQFQGRYPVYMSHIDLLLLKRFNEERGYHIDLDQIIDVREGHVFDLGNYVFKVYAVPGHSAGSLVLFDEPAGLLIAGDALGSNRPTIVDSLWMQFPSMAPIDTYLSSLQVFRAKLRGQIRETVGGHNDLPLYGEQYLDNLQRAAQRLVDDGETVLVPSLRPTNVWQVVEGDRLTDPDWAAINVSKGTCLTAPPEKIATLSNLQLSGATLAPGFTPFGLHYTASVAAGAAAIDLTPTATSSRYTNLTINERRVRSGAAYSAPLKTGDNPFTITVTAPDGSTRQTYTLVITRAAG